LERKKCGLQQISAKPDLFSIELRKILGTGRGQLLGAAPILEEAILETLCNELKIKFERSDGKSFADHIKTIREICRNRIVNHSFPTQALSSKSADEGTAGP